MDQFLPISSISEAIKLAVAPVFLLTGIGAILSVLTKRLVRAIDRARLIERRIAQVSSAKHKTVLLGETDGLWRRIYAINWAIRLSVTSALFVCVVVVSLFVADFVEVNLGSLIAYLFVIAMLLLICALGFLLFEVSISTRKILQQSAHLLPQKDADADDS